MKTIIAILLTGTLGFLFYATASNNEIYECNKWKAEAQEYDNYYLTGWQAEQCKAHNIIINIK